mgnify:CR=1 FL=1
MLLSLLACATAPVTWEVQPDPRVEVDTTRIAIAAEGRECREVADALIDTLGARPGVRIDPAATTSLRVTDCTIATQPTVEVQHEGGAVDAWATGFEEQRRVVVDGQGSANVVIYSNGLELSSLLVETRASEASPWSEEGVPSARVYSVDQQLIGGLAGEVADALVPLPVDLERRIYKDPEPGTARALHNQAVSAEAKGDIPGALALASEAYAASPTPRGARYIEALESRLGAAYAENTE